MRTGAICFLIVIFAFLLGCVSAYADGGDLTAQYQMVIGGSQSIITTGEKENARDLLGIRASSHYFDGTDGSVPLWFVYAGPTTTPTTWLWISPQSGMASGIDPDGTDSPLASVWVTVTPLHRGDHTLSAFFEQDAYFYGQDASDAYSFASVDYTYRFLGLGAQVETFHQVEASIYGPYLAIAKGPFYFQASYFTSSSAYYPDGLNVLRLKAALNF